PKKAKKTRINVHGYGIGNGIDNGTTTATATTTATNAQERGPEEVSAKESFSRQSSCQFAFDINPYFPLIFDPYVASKYGSQVRERKIDRCLKQLQEALKGTDK
ncbi:GL21832, partial [Drosophila persimilis]